MTEDVEINEDCVVRKSDRDYRLFELRVGAPGWHRNAALLNREQALRLRQEFDLFIAQAALWEP